MPQKDPGFWELLFARLDRLGPAELVACLLLTCLLTFVLYRIVLWLRRERDTTTDRVIADQRSVIELKSESLSEYKDRLAEIRTALAEAKASAAEEQKRLGERLSQTQLQLAAESTDHESLAAFAKEVIQKLILTQVIAQNLSAIAHVYGLLDLCRARLLLLIGARPEGFSFSKAISVFELLNEVKEDIEALITETTASVPRRPDQWRNEVTVPRDSQQRINAAIDRLDGLWKSLPGTPGGSGLPSTPSGSLPAAKPDSPA